MISRRALAVLPCARCLLAGADEEVRDVLALIASALAEANLAGVFARFDPAMPELAKLRSHLMSLVTRGQALSSIEVIESAGSESAYTAALDWILEIRSRSESGAMERRRGRVDVRLAKHEKRWRITSLTPVDFFAPPKPAASASAPSPQTSAAE